MSYNETPTKGISMHESFQEAFDQCMTDKDAIFKEVSDDLKKHGYSEDNVEHSFRVLSHSMFDLFDSLRMDHNRFTK